MWPHSLGTKKAQRDSLEMSDGSMVSLACKISSRSGIEKAVTRDDCSFVASSFEHLMFQDMVDGNCARVGP